MTKKTTFKIRESLAPGTIVILLAGPYMGKRAIVVKHLESGNVVVTGPYSVNGLPCRRINPRYLIATSTKVPVHDLDLSKLTDTYFQKIKESRKKNKKESEDIFMSQTNKKKNVFTPDHKKETQLSVDKPLVKFLNTTENQLLKKYLKSRFTLRDNMFPHELKF